VTSFLQLFKGFNWLPFRPEWAVRQSGADHGFSSGTQFDPPDHAVTALAGELCAGSCSVARKSVSPLA